MEKRKHGFMSVCHTRNVRVSVSAENSQLSKNQPCLGAMRLQREKGRSCASSSPVLRLSGCGRAQRDRPQPKPPNDHLTSTQRAQRRRAVGQRPARTVAPIAQASYQRTAYEHTESPLRTARRRGARYNSRPSPKPPQRKPTTYEHPTETESQRKQPHEHSAGGQSAKRAPRSLRNFPRGARVIS